ncbi:hypothetical protein MPSEU_000720800 [Mayamaea pseudoterrestris]|nr:hypothetical protein MPSEU_000720800 [Mayamaea pseudoterrestris]
MTEGSPKRNVTTIASAAPPETPASTWISSLFASPGTLNNEDDSGVALFIGNSSLFKSPPPREISLRKERSNDNCSHDLVTPLLTRSSPVSSAASSPVNQESSSNLQSNDDGEQSYWRSWFDNFDKNLYKEQVRVFLERGKIYLEHATEIFRRASQSPICVSAFFYFNLLWTLMRILHNCFAASPAVRVVAPTPAFMIDALMDQSCASNEKDCGHITLDTLSHARTAIETEVHRTWKPSELMQQAMMQMSLGQAILERVHLEYRALLAEIDRDLQLCRLPFAHACHPYCPPAAFSAEAFVDSMSLS